MKIIRILTIIVIVMCINSCDLVKEEEPEMVCTKNAPFKISEESFCGNAMVKRYIAPDSLTGAPEQIGIWINYANGNFIIGITTNIIKKGEKYYSPGTYTNKATLSYEDFYTQTGGYILVTEINRITRIISGEYNLSASNSEAAVVEISGTFKNVSF